MVQLPLSSRPIEEAQSPHVLLGKDPERQRELDSICRLIERIGAAGIPGGEIQPQHHRHSAHRGRAGTWRLAQRGVPLERYRSVRGARHCRHGQRGRELGADRRVPRRGRAGGRGCEGAAGVPSARSVHAAGLPGRHPRARHGRGDAALRDDARKPVSRAEFLPGNGRGDARRSGPRDRRRDPLVRHARQAVQRAFPQHQGAEARLHGGVSGRGRHGHGALAAGVPGGRLSGTC